MRHMEILQCYTTPSRCKIYSYLTSEFFRFFSPLHAATQLVCVSNDLLALQYFHVSQSAYLEIQASHTPIFTLFVLFLFALSNIIMHLDDTGVLCRNSASGGRGVRCVSWDKLPKEEKKKDFK